MPAPICTLQTRRHFLSYLSSNVVFARCSDFRRAFFLAIASCFTFINDFLLCAFVGALVRAECSSFLSMC
jgi:hypothetical protein